MPFKKYNRVSHLTFWIGTVVKIESEEIISVHFDHGGIRRLNLKYAKLSPVAVEKEAQLLAENERGIKETFESTDAHDSHAHGSHWEPFFENTNVLLERLPEALNRSAIVPCWADNSRSDYISFIGMFLS